jgi:hypothetical protein
MARCSGAGPQFQTTGYHEQPDISSLSYLVVLQRCHDPIACRLPPAACRRFRLMKAAATT